MKEFIIEQLREMGFDDNKIQQAVKSTPCESLAQVMEWILLQNDKEDNTTNTSTGGEQSSGGGNSQASATLKLDDNIDDSNQKELSKEELEAQKKKLEDKIKQRRIEREAKERQEEIEREKNRRKQGSELGQIKEEYARKEQIRVAEEIRREKNEQRDYLQKLRDQIKSDREAMKSNNNSGTTITAPPAPIVMPKSSSIDYNQCKLAIRLPDGKNLTHTFDANEELAAVRLFISQQTQTHVVPVGGYDESPDFKIVLPPVKTFNEDDYSKNLKDLGLCPSSRLVVSYNKK